MHVILISKIFFLSIHKRNTERWKQVTECDFLFQFIVLKKACGQKVLFRDWILLVCFS